MINFTVDPVQSSDEVLEIGAQHALTFSFKNLLKGIKGK